jgi:hypothetical protein
MASTPRDEKPDRKLQFATRAAGVLALTGVVFYIWILATRPEKASFWALMGDSAGPFAALFSAAALFAALWALDLQRRELEENREVMKEQARHAQDAAKAQLKLARAQQRTAIAQENLVLAQSMMVSATARAAIMRLRSDDLTRTEEYEGAQLKQLSDFLDAETEKMDLLRQLADRVTGRSLELIKKRGRPRGAPEQADQTGASEHSAARATAKGDANA